MLVRLPCQTRALRSLREVIKMYTEGDPRALRVLEDALGCTNKATRLRAVAMLARVACPMRIRWLDAAMRDSDPQVRETARIVVAWVCRPDRPLWPTREECSLGEPEYCAASPGVWPQDALRVREGWSYVVEVWRSDGMLLGTYAATTCAEDDQHAKCIALGRAILDSTSAHGDHFDPSDAAAFIVEKRRVPGGAGTGG
jgi:hypothetical protein